MWITSKEKHTQPLGISNLMSRCPLSERRMLHEGVAAGGELQGGEVELITVSSQREKRIKPRKKKFLVPLIACPPAYALFHICA